MRVTDQEALEELDIYNREIHRITLESRYYFWLTQFSLLVFSMVSIYISAFFVTPPSITNDQTLIPASFD
jgi:hypothetical protein